MRREEKTGLEGNLEEYSRVKKAKRAERPGIAKMARLYMEEQQLGERQPRLWLESSG